MDKVFLKATSAFMAGGEIVKPGEIIHMDASDAKNLLHRGKAVLATIEDEPVYLVPDDDADDEPGEDAATIEDEPAPQKKGKGKK